MRNNTNTTTGRKRAEQVRAGAYDGRFRTRVVKDKRKDAAKRACRDRRAWA